MLKTIATTIAISLLAIGIATAQTPQAQAAITYEMPLKTVIIKDPAANEAAEYFSTVTMLKFWIYKAGTTDDVKKMSAVFTGDPAVKQFSEGTTNGDYKEFTLELKSPKNKEWFVEKLRKAGCLYIKVNQREVAEIGKL
jgi:hypothetical protein